MAKLFTLTRERRSQNGKWTDYFVAQDDVINLEEASRKAIYDFLLTEDGKRMITYSGGEFNWGDAVMSVTDECWGKHGIEWYNAEKVYNITGSFKEITVNQDEVLVADEHLIEECEQEI